MSQPSVAAYFISRKRIASENVNTGKTKKKRYNQDPLQRQANSRSPQQITTRSVKNVKQLHESDAEIPAKIIRLEQPANSKQNNLVPFIRGGPISPRKNFGQKKDLQNAFSSKNSSTNIERGFKAPPNLPNSKIMLEKDQINKLVKKELNFEEVKSKIGRSAKLQELKASLNKLNELDKVRKLQEVKNKELKRGVLNKEKKSPAVTLKEFSTIELEALSSPKKGFTTPTKLIPSTLISPKQSLMSPRNDETPVRFFVSPLKDGTSSAIVTPSAYQRYLNLAESGKSALQLPFKYRCLIEIFKSVDTICAMFYNRKEIITFKKLKPAVQRMLRRNFSEIHLAQIKHLYPQAFNFSQMKMRNFGSTSKHDYSQLIITPIMYEKQQPDAATIDEEKDEITIINPKVLVERCQTFSNLLLNEVKEAHEKFLSTLEPPLSIPKDKITRWHPEFDLENCPDIEQAPLPQPPNMEKLSSAKDILSTARNLFITSSTPLEEEKKIAMETKQNELLTPAYENKTTASNPVANILKGIPQSLLEKIRIKQAAKAVDAITRRPSQDREAIKYSRLPELARHLRNVFITERKSVLPLETVIKKIENSFHVNLTSKEIEQYLQILSKQCPKWIAFHDIRKTIYLKMAKDMDLSQVVEKLEKTSNEKCL